MNTDQINSLIRTVLKVLGTALATHGLTNAAGILNSEDFIGLVLLIVGVISSHSWHSSAPDSNGGGSGGKLGLFVALAAAGFLFTGTGCQSTPQAVTYQTAGTTAVSVDTAMHLWGAYVAANHPGAATEAQVKAAFEKYQAAMAVVCDAGAIYAATSVTNAPAASQASLALQQAIANAHNELADLQNLIRTFGVKL